MHDTSSLSFQKNTDSIFRELIDSLADDINEKKDFDLIGLASDISMNLPAYPVSPELICVKPNVLIDHKSILIQWIGFSGVEPNFRWTDGRAAEMRFYYPENSLLVGTLVLVFDTLGEQRIIAVLNGIQVFDGVRRQQYRIIHSVEHLQKVTHLCFHFPSKTP
jgi:hypothetical protein